MHWELPFGVTMTSILATIQYMSYITTYLKLFHDTFILTKLNFYDHYLYYNRKRGFGQFIILKSEATLTPAAGRNFGGFFLKFGMVIGKGLEWLVTFLEF